MRDIKFRGLNNFNEWIYGSLVYSKNIFPAIYYEVGKGSVKAMDWSAVKRESVGQYTGLKDKEGKELYEGDIVQCPGRPWWILKTQKRYLFEVGEPMGANLFYNGDWTILSEHIFKIGNIHDNPDLISEILKS